MFCAHGSVAGSEFISSKYHLADTRSVITRCPVKGVTDFPRVRLNPELLCL